MSDTWYFSKFSDPKIGNIDISESDANSVVSALMRVSALSGNMPITVPYHQDLIGAFDQKTFNISGWENSGDAVKVSGFYQGSNIFSHSVPFTIILKK